MKKLIIIISVFLISALSLTLFLVMIEFRINLTDSIPVGLYRMTDIKNLKNAFVIFCPDNRPAFKQALARGYIDHGLCAGGFGYLMKKVVAIKGDVISATPKGVFVNHKLIAFSKPKLNDGMSRTLPQWRALNYQLKEDEIMTMTSQSEWSFDGRYYGLIHLGQIKGVLISVWVNNPLEKKHESRN